MKDLKVHFANWYDPFIPNSSKNNIFTYLLGKNFNVILDNINPDVVFYGLGNYVPNFPSNCIKIYVTGEPGSVNTLLHNENIPDRHYLHMKEANHIISSYHYTNRQNYTYFPIGLIWLYHHLYIYKFNDFQNSFEDLIKRKEFTVDDIKNKKFCVYMHWQVAAEKRNIILKKLSEYKKVDIVNCPMGHINKLNVFKDYKFSFAFMNHFWKYSKSENAKIPGLIDEKIFDSYIANTVPLFYGNAEIGDYLNSKCFLNWHDYDDLNIKSENSFLEADEKFIEKIIELDNNDELYLEYLNNNFIYSVDDLLLNDLSEKLKNII